MTRPNPTFRRRQLGRQLRRLREELGFSREEIASYLGCQLPKMSKIETGKLGVSPAELRLLLIKYDVPDEEAEEMIDLGKESRKQGWWVSFGDVVPIWLSDYVGFESEAETIYSYEAELLHGLLQTEGYARAVIRAWPGADADHEDRGVRLRAARQEVLTRNPPVNYVAIVNEAALCRSVGGPATMRQQLERLLDVMKLPNVTLRVLPLSAGAHPGMGSSFTILHMPGQSDPVVYLEELTTAAYLEKEHEVAPYKLVFDRLQDVALSERDTRKLVAEKIKEVV
ncbi:helix-turn-helix domain-containing protein [Goodfellowiella coeruleoviolacea]|uniref:Helix-turn-helix domain-containing protein n=1 Tax=Goodfellowiella coeruleoviolacea TaxID=334858 RepID=A0AAE3GFP7_9PSEU|nr:helix-turn-helix transcriptional regulator [Goodfellowiella coeruleoviolacea]MCP2166863.1 Helix-turn-helix domain-containing protein [Goodfellowiella coeruleoviolacea]